MGILGAEIFGPRLKDLSGNKKAERQVEEDSRDCRWRLCLWMSYHTARNSEVRPFFFSKKRDVKGKRVDYLCFDQS